MKPSFKIQEQNYTFEDITIRRYYGLQTILSSEDKDKEFKIVETLTGCPVKLLKKLKFQDWLVIWEETLLQVDTLKNNTDAINPIIEFNGVKYGLPAVQDLTVGEFADLEIFFTQKDSQSKIHEAAAILYRPIIKQKGEYVQLEEYDAEKTRERAEEFLDFPVSAIRSANAFFLQSATLLLKNTVGSLTSNPAMSWIPQEDREHLQSLVQLDLGGDYLIPSLEITLSDLQKQHSSKFARLSTGLPTGKTKFKDIILKFKNKLNTK